MAVAGSPRGEKKARVVALDDDQAILALLRHALKDPGYTLELFADPRAAIAAVRERPPALMLTDLSMPEVSGLEVIEAIRETHDERALPIVVVSALGDEETILRAFALGATDYIVKPFKEGELKAKIALFLARANAHKRADDVGLAFTGAELNALEGRVFAGYQVHEKRGEGGMGVVYKATAPDGRVVALKVLSQRYANDRTFLKRFFREAEHLKQVHHQNVAAFFELGHQQLAYYLAMEFVDGQSLEEYLLDKDLLSEAQIVSMIIQVARALGALHRLGIVHRDIKPGNVLLTKAGVVKLVDFGLTKHADDEQLTKTNVFFGTAAYMAPEQVRGKGELDTRSDLYALGILFYYLATGELPFDNEDTYAILYQHVHDKPRAPRSVNTGLSLTANDVILRLLAKRPAKRYQTADELCRVLEAHFTELTARGGGSG